MQVFGAEAFEDVDVRPVGGGWAVVEQAGAGEDERSCTHRHDDLGARCGGVDVVDQPLVAARGERRLPSAGDDDGEG
jgi:hypothetical protein